MKAETIGLLAIAVVLTSCAPKSEVDKCVDTWEASVSDVPDDSQKRIGRPPNYDDYTKAQARAAVRIKCMEAAGAR